MYRKLFVIVMLVSIMIVPLAAQDDGNVVADGLLSPRNMSFDSDGNLYVAEAGVAGGQTSADDNPFGASSRISVIAADGTHSVAVHGLISYREGNSLGATAVQATDESIWILLNETADFSIPFTHALVELDKETGRVKTFVDLLTIELEEDPDGNANKQSNATDFAIADDGTFYIANAGCNCLMTWSEDDGLAVYHVWDYEMDNPVPTTVEIGPDGDLYVGFLTGFPFPQGSARVERWSGGELVETFGGLTAVTGLLVTHDQTIYAVEFGVFDQGWAPGRVVMVTADGPVPVLEGLQNPYGIAQSHDGTIVVSTGSGSIISLPMMGMDG
jgi:hypothetical protein